MSEDVETDSSIDIMTMFLHSVGLWILSIISLFSIIAICCNIIWNIKLEDRITMLEHENSVLETMVHNLENRTEKNEK